MTETAKYDYPSIKEALEFVRAKRQNNRTFKEQRRVTLAHTNSLPDSMTDKKLLARRIGNALIALIGYADMCGLGILDCLHVALNASRQKGE